MTAVRRLGVRRIILLLIALALAAYIGWDRIEAHRLRVVIDAISARGEPTSMDALPAPQTAEQREAASLYAQAADLAYDRDIDENHRASRLDVEAPGGTEIPLDQIRTNYRGGDEALQLLDRATPMDFHGFDADQRGGDSFQQSKLEAGLTDLGSFACLRADLASISGDADLAAVALVPCIRLQRTLSRASTRWAHSVRILGSLRILFRHTQPSPGALATLQHAIDSSPEQDTMVNSTLLDRVRFAGMVQTSTIWTVVGVGGALEHVLLHPFRLASMRRALSAYDAPIANARRPWSERWAAVEQPQRAQMQAFVRRSESNWFVKVTDPYRAPWVWSLIWIRESAYDVAARRIAVLTISLEQYRRQHDGVLPAKIDAPEDPFSGKPLIVKQDAGGYLVYSVDVNHKDDGGILYGFGSAGLSHYGEQTPRDFGIRIPLTPQVRPGARP
jgi:hypothetical protein